MNLLKAASTVSLLTLASRVTGLVREQLIAAAFGASAATDAFNVAFRIPNLLRRLFAEGAFSQAFVPILAEHKNRDPEGVRTLVDSVATPPVPRRPTKPTYASKRRRLEAKGQRADVKAQRGRVDSS